MITFGQYDSFLKGLVEAGFTSNRVDAIAGRSSKSGLVVLKHDVEANMPVALRVARLEASYGHRATFYFQGDLLLEDGAEKIVSEIMEMGHEAALHYDVLDSNDGDYDKASAEFDLYLEKLQSFTGVAAASVCPHGNPTKVRNGWRSNKDFFRAPRSRELYNEIVDIVVDFRELLPQGLYISDAGFRLRKISNISSNDTSNNAAMSDGVEIGWSDVARLADQHEGLVLSIHPHRLRDSQTQVLLMRGRMKTLRTGYRLAKNIPGVKQLASRFYAVSRRF